MAEHFEEFVTRRGPALWRAAWLLTGDTHRAEDLVQTALMKTYPRFRPHGYETYVRTTMYRTHVSWWRRRWRGEVPTEQLPDHSAGEDTPDVGVDVARALATLPPKQRAVLVLRYFEDHTIAETARILGLAQGTVKAYTHAGLAALRTSLHLLDERGVEEQ